MSPIRNILRDNAIRLLSIGRRIDSSRGWIRMPYYHHVEEHERRGFEHQLDYLSNFGDFISLDDAVDMLTQRSKLVDGRFFCLSFDDGFKSCKTNAFPILAERNIPAAFYVVSDMVGRSIPPNDSIARSVFGRSSQAETLTFMNWDDLRFMIAHGMSVGSHTVTHTRLSQQNEQSVHEELATSKAVIERETASTCRHFCAPYGKPGADFDPIRVPALAQEAGYSSFATGLRGTNRRHEDALMLKRDHLLAEWDLYLVRYFLSQ